MRAAVIDAVTLAEQITLTDIPIPEVKSGWALVKVRAFGLNHSEYILRHEEIGNAYIRKPVIPGIECVGEIADRGDTRFAAGQKVCALMGGMGRTFNGSYAEYALLPENHIFAMDAELPREAAGAVPETYFTAWGSLFECLQFKPEDTLPVRAGPARWAARSLQPPIRKASCRWSRNALSAMNPLPRWTCLFRPRLSIC